MKICIVKKQTHHVGHKIKFKNQNSGVNFSYAMFIEWKEYGTCVFPFYGALKSNKIFYPMAVLRSTYNFKINPLQNYWGTCTEIVQLETGAMG